MPSVRRWNCKKIKLQVIKCKRVDIAIVRRERGSFFSYRPSAGAAPRSVLTHQNCGNKLKSLNQLRVDIALVRRDKAHAHIVNVRRNCKRKSLKFEV